MERTVIAVDIAKKVLRLHWVEMDTGRIERLQLKRAKLLEWFVDILGGRDRRFRMIVYTDSGRS